MRVNTFEETLRSTPFRPFTIHADGRIVLVDHPELVLITPDRSTAIVALRDGGVFIVDMDHISSLSIRRRNGTIAKKVV